MEKPIINVAVVGCGRIGKTHCNAVIESNDIFKLTHVVDSDEERCTAFADEFKTNYYTKLEELYYDKSINAVIICLPHNLHMPVAIDSMRAGKHVLVEKPMAKNTEEAKKMVEVSIETGKNIMVGQSRRFFDAVILSKEKLTEVGEPFSILYHWGSSFKEESAPEWWKDKDKTGGLIIPMSGSHAVDQVMWYYNKTPKSVYAKIYNSREFWEGSSEASIILEFGENQIATLRLSLTYVPVIHQVIISGSKGTINMSHLEEQDRVGVGYWEVALNHNTLFKGDQEPSNFYYQDREFGLAILEDREPIASGKEIIERMKVLDAIEKSVKSNAPIMIE